MDRADPGAGQHREGCFGDHRHVEDDAVALADAKTLQDVGEAADMVVELAIGDILRDRRIIAFPDNGCLVAAGRHMAVDAVGADIELTVFEPFDRDVAGAEIGRLDLAERFDPVDPLAMLRPESGRIGDRRIVHFFVGCGIDIGLRRERCGRRETILVGH